MLYRSLFKSTRHRMSACDRMQKRRRTHSKLSHNAIIRYQQPAMGRMKMTRLLRAGLTVCLLVWGQVSAASSWWYVGTSGPKPRRFVYFLDKDSKRQIRPNVFQVWESDYNETQTSSRAWASEKILTEYNCVDRTTTMINYIEYDRSGVVIKSYSAPAYSRTIEPAAPDTVAEAMLKVACGETQGTGPLNPFEPALSGKVALSIIDEPSK